MRSSLPEKGSEVIKRLLSAVAAAGIILTLDSSSPSAPTICFGHPEKDSEVIQRLLTAVASAGITLTLDSSPASAPTIPFGHCCLSQQQFEILALVAAGDSHTAVARNLGIHVGSVKSQIARLKDKLEVTTAQELHLVHRLCCASSQLCWMTGNLCPHCPKSAHTSPSLPSFVKGGCRRSAFWMTDRRQYSVVAGLGMAQTGPIQLDS